ncbi:MAG: hypothetical protein IH910_09825 [Proteobacteria bacterium]|nr:hypothetical protein [Pseudomonadota bacterium]
MNIIFNSDLLFATYLIEDRLPRVLSDFLQTCGENGHEIVIPETTLLEFDRKQAEFLDKEILELNKARTKLEKYEVNFDDFESAALARAPDLVALIGGTGATCSVVHPTLADFQSAHRKACSREAPHPPDIKSDEMRDLVIWEISLRIASPEDCTILMSRDELHTHHRGNSEASNHGLIRCDSFERAYESLSIETESGRVLRQLVSFILDDLIAGDDLPLIVGAQLVSVKRPTFVDTNAGTTIVKAKVKFNTGAGTELAATMTFEYAGTSPFTIKFEDTREDDSDIEDFFHRIAEPPHSTDDIIDRKRGLSELIGE